MPKIKPISIGKTPFEDLYACLGLESQEQLNKRKVRLFPLGKAIDEVATTSIYLASLCAVKEYREELLTKLGVSKVANQNVQLQAYVEVSDKDGNRPDGLLVLTSGKRTPIIEWVAFVESKVGNNDLQDEQISRYVEFGKTVGVKNIITISNQLVSTPNDSPVKLKGRNSCKLYHWSWQYLKVTAQFLNRTNAVKDEDHVYILEELYRYFNDHKNITNFTNMGKNWSEASIAIHDLSPEQKVKASLVDEVLTPYIQEEKDVALQLTAGTAHYVQLLTKGDRFEELSFSLQKSKTLVSSYIVDNDKSNSFDIEIDFIRQSVCCSTTVVVDKGKAQAQTTALLKMFESESGYTDSIYIDAYYPRNKKMESQTLAYLFKQKEEGSSYSILNKSFGDEVKKFTIRTKDLLGKDFKATKNFITQLELIAERFLTQVVVNIKR